MSSKITSKRVREMIGNSSLGSFRVVMLSAIGRSSIFRVKRMSSLSSTIKILPRFVIIRKDWFDLLVKIGTHTHCKDIESFRDSSVRKRAFGVRYRAILRRKYLDKSLYINYLTIWYGCCHLYLK